MVQLISIWCQEMRAKLHLQYISLTIVPCFGVHSVNCYYIRVYYSVVCVVIYSLYSALQICVCFHVCVLVAIVTLYIDLV